MMKTTGGWTRSAESVMAVAMVCGLEAWFGNSEKTAVVVAVDLLRPVVWEQN